MGSSTQSGTPDVRQRRPAAQWPSSQASPEDVFLVWLMGLPADADVAAAARAEVARLDRAAPLRPGPARLRELMLEAAKAA